MEKNLASPNRTQNMHTDPAVQIPGIDIPWRHFLICTPGNEYRNSHDSIVNNSKNSK